MKYVIILINYLSIYERKGLVMTKDTKDKATKTLSNIGQALVIISISISAVLWILDGRYATGQDQSKLTNRIGKVEAVIPMVVNQLKSIDHKLEIMLTKDN